MASQITSSFTWYPPSEKQMKVLTWWQEGSPHKDKFGIICDGSVRAGKSLIMSFSFVIWAMESFRHKNFAMAGKTIGSFKRNVWINLKIILKLRGYHITKISDMDNNNAYMIKKNGIENYFFIFGGKDEQSQDLISGITLNGLFLDEATLMPESFFLQAIARCSMPKAKVWINCNPNKPGHYIKVDWLDKKDEKNLYHLHFTMEDNPSLDEETKERYRSIYSGVFYSRYILGLWVLASGLIYGSSFRDEIHMIDVDLNIRYVDYYVSVDYGTQNPMSFHLWGFNMVLKRFECIKEYYYCGRDEEVEKDDQEYYTDLCKFIGDIIPTYIVIDPSASSFITFIKNRQRYRVKKADNAVEDGIRNTSTALKLKAIVFDKSCVNSQREFQSYVYKEGTETPIKEDDHTMDSIRYFVKTVLFKGFKWVIDYRSKMVTGVGNESDNSNINRRMKKII